MTKKWIRRLGLGFAALLLLLVAAAVFLITTFDANSYKAQAIDWMKAERQRVLAIDGPIELSVFPDLALRVSGVRLSERGGDAQFLAVDEASLSVRTMPLLRGELVVDRVSARGVHVDYKRDASGVRNFDDLLGRLRDPSPAGKEAVPADGSVRFDVSSIVLEDLRLKVNDEKAGLAGVVTVQSFKSGRIADQVETPVSFRSTLVLSQPGAVDLTLAGSATFKPDRARSGIAASRLKLEIGGAAAGISQLAMTLEGALAWEGGRLSGRSSEGVPGHGPSRREPTGRLLDRRQARTVRPRAATPRTRGLRGGAFGPPRAGCVRARAGLAEARGRPGQAGRQCADGSLQAGGADRPGGQVPECSPHRKFRGAAPARIRPEARRQRGPTQGRRLREGRCAVEDRTQGGHGREPRAPGGPGRPRTATAQAQPARQARCRCGRRDLECGGCLERQSLRERRPRGAGRQGCACRRQGAVRQPRPGQASRPPRDRQPLRPALRSRRPPMRLSTSRACARSTAVSPSRRAPLSTISTRWPTPGSKPRWTTAICGCHA